MMRKKYSQLLRNEANDGPDWKLRERKQKADIHGLIETYFEKKVVQGAVPNITSSMNVTLNQMNKRQFQALDTNTTTNSILNNVADLTQSQAFSNPRTQTAGAFKNHRLSPPNVL